MNAFWASENFEAFIVFRSPQPRGFGAKLQFWVVQSSVSLQAALDSNQEWSSFPVPDQIEALDRRMDQLFGLHAALANWLRATTASIPFLSRIVRGTHSIASLRAKWMTSQVLAIGWEGAVAPGRDEQHLTKKYHLKLKENELSPYGVRVNSER